MLNWYYQSGKESDVVLSTRIRFTRNIEGIPFVTKFTEAQAKEVLDRVEALVTNAQYNLKFLRLENIDELTRSSLIEKHIISPNFLEKSCKNKGLLINEDENICIMVNEDDHIRLQVLSSGFDLDNTLLLAMEIENKLDNELKFAYNEKYGYLASSPMNIGTGLRASVMVHLPGLTKTQNISKILEAVNNMGMNIRGVYGDGTKSRGNVYQISNKQTLGACENDIIKNLKAIIDKIRDQERLARKLLTKNQIELEDNLYRSYGILTNAKKISTEEIKTLLSDVRLGVDMGIIKDITDLKVNKIDILTKPANLQKYYNENLNCFDRDIKRAELVKKIINE